MTHIPEFGFLRVNQIIGNPKKGIPPIIPVSKTLWWEGVKSGRFPKPVRLGRITVWRVEDIRAFIESPWGFMSGGDKNGANRRGSRGQSGALSAPDRR